MDAKLLNKSELAMVLIELLRLSAIFKLAKMRLSAIFKLAKMRLSAIFK